ncbi:secreted RxLR effector protein 161-like [Quercus suber]|uniref:secreted RxLR effector protein 161-like n=1 Tax=Quercus suber TaxID=58331 RepID=UPI0032DF6EBA
MSPNVKLIVDLLGKSVDSSPYRSMIGSLLYLTASRLNISYNVGVCARYQANLKESHMIALKRIIKYVKTIANFGVWYSKNTNDVLVGYFDVNCARNADDRESTSRDCFYVGNNLVSWMGKKQNSISISTTEAEYIAAGSCCTQLLWMQKLLLAYGIRQEHLTIYCDNTNAINISKNPIQYSRTKHIEIRHHFIREFVEDGTLTLEFIHTDDQKADLFTKPLDSKQFEFYRQNIGVISMD